MTCHFLAGDAPPATRVLTAAASGELGTAIGGGSEYSHLDTPGYLRPSPPSSTLTSTQKELANYDNLWLGQRIEAATFLKHSWLS